MRLRSAEDLDHTLAWRRVLWWARRRLEVPDRLPFEVAERLFPGGPTLRSEHHLQAPIVVMGTKGSGTVRPFVRLPAVDVLLYQSLVDRVAPAVEGALLPRDCVFAYRQSLDDDENPFVGTPTWRDFAAAARNRLEENPDAYCLRADVSGYFLQVNADELERALLEKGAPATAARDLAELLRNWQILGIRGLPQGIPASSPLGNFYLYPLDDAIRSAGFQHVRYMDDVWVFTDSFSEARRVQDVIEKFLYPFGLSLSGEKSRVERRRTALTQAETADAIIEGRREIFHEGFQAMAAESPYPDEEAQLEPQEIDAVAVLDLYEEILTDLRQDTYPPLFRQTLRAIYRELGSARRAEALGDIPEVVTRFPDLTGDAMAYAAYAAETDREAANEAFAAVLGGGRFHREQELLQICRSALYLAPSDELAASFGSLATSHEHPVVRARALLAWGSLSDRGDFSTGDRFWRRAQRAWRAYPFVAIQDKDEVGRDGRYENWSSSGRLLDRLRQSIQGQRFSWKKV